MGVRGRVLVGVASAVAALAFLAVAAQAQDPCDLTPELPICESTEEPGEDPSAEPSDQPSAEPSPSPSAEPSPSPSAEPSPSPAPEPSPSSSAAPDVGTVEPPTFDTGDAPAPGTTDGAPAPEVAEPAGQDGGGTRPVVFVGVDDLAAALPGTFGLGLLAALLGVATMIGTRGLLRRGGLVAHTEDGGTDVERTRFNRTMTGVVLLVAAAAVGVAGYMKISLEPVVAVQVVYLASAGFAVIILAVAGGSLIVSDQLRADEHRIDELEAAVGAVAEHLRPQVQEPPRLLERSGPEATPDPDEQGTS